MAPDSLKLQAYTLHTVTEGETVESIAKQAGVTVADLKKCNPGVFLDGYDAAGKLRKADGWWIYPGDLIRLPQGTTPAPAPAPSPANPTLDQAKQTILTAAIQEPPKDLSKLLAWVEASNDTLAKAQAALPTLETAVKNGQLPATEYTKLQARCDQLLATYRGYLEGVTATVPTKPTPVAPKPTKPTPIPSDPGRVYGPNGQTHASPAPATAPTATATEKKAINRAAAILEGAQIQPLPTDMLQAEDWYNQSRATLREVHGALGVLFDATKAGKFDPVAFNEYLAKAQGMVQEFNLQVAKMDN